MICICQYVDFPTPSFLTCWQLPRQRLRSQKHHANLADARRSRRTLPRMTSVTSQVTAGHRITNSLSLAALVGHLISEWMIAIAVTIAGYLLPRRAQDTKKRRYKLPVLTTTQSLLITLKPYSDYATALGGQQPSQRTPCQGE